MCECEGVHKDYRSGQMSLRVQEQEPIRSWLPDLREGGKERGGEMKKVSEVEGGREGGREGEVTCSSPRWRCAVLSPSRHCTASGRRLRRRPTWDRQTGREGGRTRAEEVNIHVERALGYHSYFGLRFFMTGCER